MDAAVSKISFNLIPIQAVRPSPHNYRKSFKADKMVELTESVREKGVIQPLLVRPINPPNPPLTKGDGEAGGFEVVAGHRRYQAALAAGLPEIPCIIRELSDADALEIQVTENDQREDPNPMDQAEGYRRLMEMRDYSFEQLAEKVKKSVKYCRERIKLLELCEEAQKAVAEESISLGVGLALTRLRNEDDQKQILADVLDPEGHGATARQVHAAIDEISTDLSGAVFDLTECAACPSRAKNQAELFAVDTKKDYCNDRACFHQKTKDALYERVAELKKQGFRILKKAEWDKNRYSYYGKCAEIQAPTKGSTHRNNNSIPRLYKSECIKCVESHVYYLEELEMANGTKRLRLLEMCMDLRCFRKMQEPEKKKATDSDVETEEPKTESADDRKRRLALKAKEFRDRWLKANMPQVITESELLRKRLELFLLAANISRGARAEFVKPLLKDFNIDAKMSEWIWDDELYRLLALIPTDFNIEDAIIGRVIDFFALAQSPEVYLEVIPEAGIDTKTLIPVDEEYLKSLKTPDLPELIKAFKLPIEPKPSWTKTNLIQAILAHPDKLIGLKTPELKAVFTPKGCAPASARNENPVDLAEDVTIPEECGCNPMPTVAPDLNPAPDHYVELCVYCANGPTDSEKCDDARDDGEVERQRGLVVECSGFEKMPEKKEKKSRKKKEPVEA